MTQFLWGFGILAAVIGGIFFLLYRPLRIKKKLVGLVEITNIAHRLAYYFGTWRKGINGDMDPVKMGEWALWIMCDVADPKAFILRSIAHHAIVRKSWPHDHTPGTTAFLQVAQAIQTICRHLQQHGLPAEENIEQFSP